MIFFQLPLLICILIQFNLCGCYVKDLAIDDVFGQEKGFRRILIQPNQIDKIEVDSYFRGHFLDFKIEANNETNKSFEAGNKLITNNIIQFQEPIRIKHPMYKYYDTPQPVSLFSLQCLFIDDGNGVKDILIFYNIDNQLKLNAYDLSAYLNFVMVPIKQQMTDLFSGQYLSDKKRCTYLIQIDDHTLATACLSKNGSTATMLVITVIDYSKRNFKLDYYPSSILYSEFTGGNLIHLRSLNHSNDYINFILLSNKSSTDIKVVSVNKTNNIMFLKAQYNSLILTDQLTKIDKIYHPLMIQDIEVVYLRNDMVLATDYVHGLFILFLKCNIKECTINLKSIYNYPGLGEITMPKLEDSEYVSNALISINQPPKIKEIIIEDSNNPYLGWEYYILTDKNTYLGLNIMDSNDRYIIIAILRMNDYQPFIRVYDRKDSLKSYGFIQIPIYQASFNDIFVYSLQYNHFFLRTGEYFIIYAIQSSSFIINTLNVDLMDSLQIYDQIVAINLKVSDYTGRQLETIVEIIILPIYSNKTIALQPTLRENMSLESELLSIQYQCGQYQDQIKQMRIYNTTDITDSFVIQTIDDIFSGPFNKMIVTPSYQDIQEYYFEIWTPRIQKSYQNNQDFSECRQNKVLKFDIEGDTHHRFVCISQTNFSIFTVDMVHDNYRQIDNMNPFYLPDLSITAYIVDFESSMIFLFTEKNRRNQSFVTMHILRLSNQIEWVSIIRLGEQYQILQEFKFSKRNPVVYNGDVSMGLLKSEPDEAGISKIIIFKMTIKGDDIRFDLRAYYEIQINHGDFIRDIDIADSFRVWVLLNNNTMISYQLQRVYKKTLHNLEYRLKKIFEFIPYSYNGKYESEVHGFDFLKNYLIFFIGKNLIQVIGFEDGVISIESNFTLPLSYQIAQEAKDNYVFLYNQIEKIQFTTHSTFLIIPFYNTLRNVTRINMYKLNQVRQNTLYLEEDIPQGFRFHDNFTSVDHFHINDNLIQIVLTTINTSVQFNVELGYSIRMNYIEATKLDQKCKNSQEQICIQYQIFPIENPDQKIQFDLNAINTGLMITKDKESLSSTIMIMTKPIQYGIYNLNGQANINELFYGFQMNFDITPLETRIQDANNQKLKSQNENDDTADDTSSDIYGDLAVEKIIMLNKPQPIDFLSNTNQLVELFTIGDFIVWLDQSGFFFVTKDVQANQYERFPSMSLIGCIPNLFTKYESNVFIFQCNGTVVNYTDNVIIFGATKAYTKLPKNADSKYFHSFFDGSLWIKFTKHHIRQQLKISSAAIYEYSNYQYYVALVFDIESSDQVSYVSFHNITITNTNTEYYLYPERTIHALTFGKQVGELTCSSLQTMNNFLLNKLYKKTLITIILYLINQEQYLQELKISPYSQIHQVLSLVIIFRLI
ncbi:UNKNOWN [Stylonychia lemnae]|uniref:Transmembrane protein n=1 Tax=Stylonychia lemnae TaxID=5949 RepID=A0A078AGE1_STYLE|nr:UNKNOWN [Stylonychia lemnae]|eukprot:CDW81309.1 UNKNOWN [Stylonychia lemnae]